MFVCANCPETGDLRPTEQLTSEHCRAMTPASFPRFLGLFTHRTVGAPRTSRQDSRLPEDYCQAQFRWFRSISRSVGYAVVGCCHSTAAAMVWPWPGHTRSRPPQRGRSRSVVLVVVDAKPPAPPESRCKSCEKNPNLSAKEPRSQASPSHSANSILMRHAKLRTSARDARTWSPPARLSPAAHLRRQVPTPAATCTASRPLSLLEISRVTQRARVGSVHNTDVGSQAPIRLWPSADT